MIYIFKGIERIRNEKGEVLQEGRNAIEMQNDIHLQICKCENNASIKHKKEGKFIVTIEKETILEATERIRQEHQDNHLPFDKTTIKNSDIKIKTTSEVKENVERKIYFSPNLKKIDNSQITIDDFPDGHNFGNGVTANAKVLLKDGNFYYFSWCILPENTILTQTKKESLRSICED